MLYADPDDCTQAYTPRTAEYFWAHIKGMESLDAIEFENGGTYERQLIRRAWATLRDAMEVVEWAYCLWAHGADETGCFRNRLNGTGLTDKVKFEFVDGEEHTFHTMGSIRGTLFHNPRIEVYREGGVWGAWIEGWKTGGEAAQRCIAIEAAAVLAHELVHLCDSSSDDDDPDPSVWCYESYVIQSIVLYGLYLLHPHALDCHCCKLLWTTEAFYDEGRGLFAHSTFPSILSVVHFSPSGDAGYCWEEDTGGTALPSEGSSSSSTTRPTTDHDSPITDDKGLVDWPDPR